MSLMLRSPTLALAGILLAIGGSAQAATYYFQTDLPDISTGGSIYGYGKIVTEDTTTTSGADTGYLVTAISGVYYGQTITGLEPVNYTGGNDNLLDISGGGVVDTNGIAFSITDESVYDGVVNIFASNVAGTYSDNGPTGAGTFTLSSVPEPTTWALMLLGFGSVGSAMRRRRVAAVAA